MDISLSPSVALFWRLLLIERDQLNSETWNGQEHGLVAYLKITLSSVANESEERLAHGNRSTKCAGESKSLSDSICGQAGVKFVVRSFFATSFLFAFLTQCLRRAVKDMAADTKKHNKRMTAALEQRTHGARWKESGMLSDFILPKDHFNSF